ncbi:MAG TPA: hypothetical protein VHY56_06805, partial [Candidatus Binataceae bacterium]|nr:hypothetical protein [Candidatus Binataceae bacterium]
RLGQSDRLLSVIGGSTVGSGDSVNADTIKLCDAGGNYIGRRACLGRRIGNLRHKADLIK